jgi:PhnB protein
MRFTPYLGFNGDCEAAFRYYEHVFGGKLVALFPIAGTPAAENTPAEFHNQIMHARLQVGDQELMGSDACGMPYQTPQGLSVSIHIDTPEEAERVFNALADNGSVTMPIQETFWALRFGMVTDRFGTPWMINCEKSA